MYVTIENMITGLVSAGKQEALPLAYILAALVFENKDDLEWLKERFAMLEEIFQDSWAYQDIFHKGEAKGSQRTLSNVIEARFPEIVPLVQKYIDTIVDLEVFQDLVVKASTAEKNTEVIQAISDATKANGKS